MSTDSLRETIYAKISDAFYDARNSGRTMTDAANEAADAVLAALAPPTMEQIAGSLQSEVVDALNQIFTQVHSFDIAQPPSVREVLDAVEVLLGQSAQQIAALYPSPTHAERGQ